MNTDKFESEQGVVIEEHVHLTLVELCQACRASPEHVVAWVYEGVLEPLGTTPEEWHFTGASLRRARLAAWLTQDLEVNPPGIAFALDLLDEIARLRAHLQRVEQR